MVRPIRVGCISEEPTQPSLTLGSAPEGAREGEERNVWRGFYGMKCKKTLSKPLVFQESGAFHVVCRLNIRSL
jgi:hypothetical protein